ncbi:MAG: hypothetical protein KAT74_09335, partial [Candidatus Cloacimonetes bacterium]|nr:hypothetical protein [Candidatus Cloacimonadota bacterium]
MKTFSLLFSFLFILLSVFIVNTASAQSDQSDQQLYTKNTSRAPFISATNTQHSMQNVMQNSEKEIIFIENLGQITDTKGNKRP